MTDKQLAQEGKVIKFGIAQLRNQTPYWMKWCLRGVQFASGVWALVPPDLIGMSDLTAGTVNRWILLSNSVLFFAIKFFGWDTPASDNNQSSNN